MQLATSVKASSNEGIDAKNQEHYEYHWHKQCNDEKDVLVNRDI